VANNLCWKVPNRPSLNYPGANAGYPEVDTVVPESLYEKIPIRFISYKKMLSLMGTWSNLKCPVCLLQKPQFRPGTKEA